LDVVALVGHDPDKTARRAERAGVGVAAGSLEEALKVPGGDIVIVATPPNTHAILAEEAIAAGRHVLVEKPFTLDVDEARRIEGAAQRAGVVALVGHEFRFAPERAAFRQVLVSGQVGAPRLATFIGHQALAAPMDMKAPPWWFDRAGGGGWLGASVSHLVDAIRWWLGEFATVSTVLPMVSQRDPDTDAEDTVSARFRLRSGCEGVLQQSASVWGGGVNLMRVAGPGGTVEILDGTVTFTGPDGVRPVEPLLSTPLEVQPSNDPRHRFTHLELGPAVMQATVLRDLVLGSAPSYDVNPATFSDGVACMEVLDAMRNSAAAGGLLVEVGR
jgi:predicted dehydrogenase